MRYLVVSGGWFQYFMGMHNTHPNTHTHTKTQKTKDYGLDSRIYHLFIMAIHLEDGILSLCGPVFGFSRMMVCLLSMSILLKWYLIEMFREVFIRLIDSFLLF